MTSLYKYIGPEIDIPGGDIGVGRREIGYLFGQYKLLTQKHEGAFTGKGLNWGGSLLRPQTVGFGAVYLANEVLIAHGDDIKGKTIAISGYGLASIGVIIKAKQFGAKVVTISGPDGYIYDENGIDTDEKINFLKDLLNSYAYRISPYAKKFGSKFIEEKKPWEVPVDMAFPCAFQNELDIKDAADLNRNGVRYVIETSNLGCTSDAVKYLIKNRITFVPSKAANAGGIALSGLEMAQNSMKLRWNADEVDTQLKNIMSNIHTECLKEGRESDGYVNYVKGANIAGFKKVADAMIDLGW
jgi:glutamate dehydrogenase (NADP+)